MEVSQVRKRLTTAITGARERAQRRRQRAVDAERTYETFLDQVAIPVARQVANALKVEGYGFTVFTPRLGLRLASDRSRDDFIDISLDTSGDEVEVVGRISRARGSRTIDDERPIKAGASPDQIGEEDVLDFLLEALEPWLER